MRKELSKWEPRLCFHKVHQRQLLIMCCLLKAAERFVKVMITISKINPHISNAVIICLAKHIYIWYLSRKCNTSFEPNFSIGKSNVIKLVLTYLMVICRKLSFQLVQIKEYRQDAVKFLWSTIWFYISIS